MIVYESLKTIILVEPKTQIFESNDQSTRCGLR